MELPWPWPNCQILTVVTTHDVHCVHAKNVVKIQQHVCSTLTCDVIQTYTRDKDHPLVER
jgi:hypothetical protein